MYEHEGFTSEGFVILSDRQRQWRAEKFGLQLLMEKEFLVYYGKNDRIANTFGHLSKAESPSVVLPVGYGKRNI